MSNWKNKLIALLDRKELLDNDVIIKSKGRFYAAKIAYIKIDETGTKIIMDNLDTHVRRYWKLESYGKSWAFSVDDFEEK